MIEQENPHRIDTGFRNFARKTAKAGNINEEPEKEIGRYNVRVKRFRRWLFNGLLALSIMTIGLWIGSYYREGMICYVMQSGPVVYENYIRLNLGVLYFGHNLDTQGFPQTGFTILIDTPTIEHNPLTQTRNGGASWRVVFPVGHFGLVRWHTASRHGGELTLPCWFLSIILITPPCVWIFRRSRTRQFENANLCANCGYDLHATPERCPECGTIRSIRVKTSNRRGLLCFLRPGRLE
jgi:predicted RNA-binding Zn-ribbon protein involved in translation (DUF1610 family)